jgi:hypothetical protein
MLFMLHRPATVIALMQPGWCDRSWVYVNQAALLGIEPIVVCADAFFSLASGGLDLMASYQQSSQVVVQKHALVDFFQYSWLDGSLSQKFLNQTMHLNLLGPHQSGMLMNSIRHDLSSKRLILIDSPKAFHDNYALSPQGLIELFSFYVSEATAGVEGIFNFFASLELKLAPSLRSAYEVLFNTHPSLSVCFRGRGFAEYRGTFFEKSCIRQSDINLFSKLEMIVNVPHVVVHLWLQSSPKGFKIEGSDLYLPLAAQNSEYRDLRLIYDYPDKPSKFCAALEKRPFSSSFRFVDESETRILKLGRMKEAVSCMHYVQAEIRDFIREGNYLESQKLTVLIYITKALLNYIKKYMT